MWGQKNSKKKLVFFCKKERKKGRKLIFVVCVRRGKKKLRAEIRGGLKVVSLNFPHFLGGNFSFYLMNRGGCN